MNIKRNSLIRHTNRNGKIIIPIHNPNLGEQVKTNDYTGTEHIFLAAQQSSDILHRTLTIITTPNN